MQGGNWTSEQFVRLWRSEIARMLARDYTVSQIEMCVGLETLARYGGDLNVLAQIGMLKERKGPEDEMLWGDVRLVPADAPRALHARPQIEHLLRRKAIERRLGL